jgi:hypothetical protein
MSRRQSQITNPLQVHKYPAITPPIAVVTISRLDDNEKEPIDFLVHKNEPRFWISGMIILDALADDMDVLGLRSSVTNCTSLCEKVRLHMPAKVVANALYHQNITTERTINIPMNLFT